MPTVRQGVAGVSTLLTRPFRIVSLIDAEDERDAGIPNNRLRSLCHMLDAEQGKAVAEMEMLLGRELFDPDLNTRASQ